MKQITIEEVLTRKPCYTCTQILKITEGREALTALEICGLTAPPEDLLWVLLHRSALPERILHELACDFAEHALQAEQARGRQPDKRSWEALAVKRRWLHGRATDAELANARQTAAYAAADAADAAAADAAYAAADAAYAAADAAYAAADAAYAAADAKAERRWQLNHVREIIQKDA